MRHLSLTALALWALALPLTAQESVAPPLMGWSSWNTYHVNISEELIQSQADALVRTGLKEAGYRYINIDDGFFGYRDSTGLMHAHPQRFPNGMRVVSDYIHSLGLRAGIYSDAGDNTCGSIYDGDANGVGSGLYGHEKQDMELYLKDWNYDFIKIDYCGARDLGLEEEQRYTTICQAIAATWRTDVSINICRWAFPGTWAARLARSWRISPDIRPRWKSIKAIVEKNLYLAAYAGGGHYNDMDMLEIGRGLSTEEEEVHFGLWCIMSSPLLIGSDLNTIPPATLALLKNPELIAINQDPLGLQAYVAQHENAGYVLVKDLQQRQGLCRAVALYNPSDSVCHFRVPLGLLEMDGKVKARDIIRRKDIGTIKDEIHCDVPAHNIAMWKIEGQRRTERTNYEAECAYLHCYDDLGKRNKAILYAPDSLCSGGMKVINLGGREENYAQWNDVYSEQGGEYLLTVYYRADKDRKLCLTVNDAQYDLHAPANPLTVAHISVRLTLRPGFNDIRMGNRFGWAPDIDRFTLQPVKP